MSRLLPRQINQKGLVLKTYPDDSNVQSGLRTTEIDSVLNLQKLFFHLGGLDDFYERRGKLLKCFLKDDC